MTEPFPSLSDSETELLRNRLEEAVAWCLPRVTPSDPKRSTRSPPLEPSRQFSVAVPDGGRFTYDHATSEQRRRLVDEVCRNRSRCLAESGSAVNPVGPELAGGRLLSSSIDGSDWSELPTTESHEFLDSFDIPGWDTWLWLYPEISTHDLVSGECVLCWVPAQIVPLAQAAVEVSAMESLWWVEYSDVFRGADADNACDDGCRN